MMTIVKGKIEKISIGRGGYDDAMFGLTFKLVEA